LAGEVWQVVRETHEPDAKRRIDPLSQGKDAQPQHSEFCELRTIETKQLDQAGSLRSRGVDHPILCNVHMRGELNRSRVGHASLPLASIAGAAGVEQIIVCPRAFR
jgi:hypothetical protein